MPISQTFLYLSVADPDLQIRGRPGHPDPEIRGRGLQKHFFRPFGPHFWSKNKGGPGPLDSSPGSATAYKKTKSIFLKFATILY